MERGWEEVRRTSRGGILLRHPHGGQLTLTPNLNSQGRASANVLSQIRQHDIGLTATGVIARAQADAERIDTLPEEVVTAAVKGDREALLAKVEEVITAGRNVTVTTA